MDKERILLLSHTVNSFKIYNAGLGEMGNAEKLHQLMKLSGYSMMNIEDIPSLCGEPFDHTYKDISKINLDLADQGHEIISSNLTEIKQIYHRVAQLKPNNMLVLSWNFYLAALFGAKIQSLCPTIAKLYIFLEQNLVQAPLYDPAHFVITENLLANKKGIDAGIPPWKMMYLPHHYQDIHVKTDHSYLEKLAAVTGKALKRNHETIVIGMVSRIRMRKNNLLVFEAIEKLIEEGRNIILVVRGEIEIEDSEFLEEKTKEFSMKPWFLWDREFTPLSGAYQKYQNFDLFLHLSGWEGASNIVVEMMGLGIPSIVLDGTTNPYLFKDGAFFIKRSERDGKYKVRFHKPDEEDLYEKLKALVDSKKLREEWGKRGKEIARKRFHPSLTLKRLPLMFESAKSNWKNEMDSSLKSQVEKLYRDDLRLYGLEDSCG